MPKKAALIFTAILFSVAIIYFAVAEKNSGDVVVVQKQSAFAVLSEIAILDSDKDGLKDWEEELWKTNPHNPDTDGDGTTDNDELNVGRNPTVAGPNDLLSSDVISSLSEKSSPKIKMSVFAEELFVEYIELKNSGKLTPKSERALIERVVANNIKGVVFEKYTVERVHLVSDSEENILNYKANIQTIFREFKKVEESELVTLARALETNSEEDFKKLDSSIAIYAPIISDLSKLEVPQEARFIHVDLLNGLHYFVGTIINMRNLQSNPLEAMVSIKEYATVENYIGTVFTELNAYFEYKELTR